MLLLSLMLGCTATIQAYGVPKGATVYLTKGDRPTPSQKPILIEAEGKLPDFVYTGSYWVWESFYLWVSKPGYETRVVKVPNEAKVGPIIGTVFCLFPVLWAAGPKDTPINIELDRK